jgi:hypothetical protein
LIVCDIEISSVDANVFHDVFHSTYYLVVSKHIPLPEIRKISSRVKAENMNNFDSIFTGYEACELNNFVHDGSFADFLRMHLNDVISSFA